MDLIPVVEAIIVLAATAITIFLIPWLRECFGNEKLEKACGWVEIAVLAAEKLYGAGVRLNWILTPSKRWSTRRLRKWNNLNLLRLNIR